MHTMSIADDIFDIFLEQSSIAHFGDCPAAFLEF